MADTGVTEALQGESTTPSLTLNPFGTEEAPKPAEIQLTTGKQEVADAKEVIEQQLTPEEMKMVDDFGDKCCRFLGVFKPDHIEYENGKQKRIYKRIATTVTFAEIVRKS